jgi:hypothetical protein
MLRMTSYTRPDKRPGKQESPGPELPTLPQQSQSNNQAKALDENIAFSRTCGLLENLIGRYRSAANRVYSSNPESLSIMLLTIMELWVACNKSAQSYFPFC